MSAMTMSAPTHAATAAAYALGLALTLVLAGCLSPRRWWRRPTAGNLALAGAGTLAFGLLFCALFAALLPARPRPFEPAPLAALVPAAPAYAMPLPRYRVIDDLNLRAAKATGAPRLAVLPAGTLVTPTGMVDGDWLQIRARYKGRTLEGWASSLWLRRVDEGLASEGPVGQH
jgi:hypothetical protein